jgi:MFS family permease
MGDPVDPANKPDGSNQSFSLRDEEAPSPYSGKGTTEDPYVVEFLPGDPQNPMNFPTWRKWLLTSIVTMSAFAVSLTSSAYSSSGAQVTKEFNVSGELFNAGVALYVFGFALGPAVWAPLSELYGRQMVFIVALGVMTAFVGATAGANNMASVLIFRFLTAVFGAAPLTNAGGAIADLFPVSQRGFAMSIFATAPFMGPTLGPIMGGFVTITVGWRWVQGVCCIFMGVIWIVGMGLLPETYGPVLLQRIAQRLSKKTGKVHISALEKDNGGVRLSEVFGKVLKRPWALLFWEPMVLISSIYMSILYGTLYMFFPAFPIVYEQLRGWNAGIGSLPFLGLAVGMLLGLIYTIVDDELRYRKLGNKTTPESRLPPAMVGAIALPIGMFSFAWTNSPSIHWSASVILSAPFGFGTVLVFIALFNYQLDSYTIYAASVLAAGAMLRAFVGGAFPLFTTYMFQNLGIHWASSIPAFLTVSCLPFPFVMYRFGEEIRMKCKYAHEAAVLMARMQAKDGETQDGEARH